MAPVTACDREWQLCVSWDAQKLPIYIGGLRWWGRKLQPRFNRDGARAAGPALLKLPGNKEARPVASLL